MFQWVSKVGINGDNEELVSFDISALFTSIPVPTSLDIINKLFTEHTEDQAKGMYGCSFTGNTCDPKKDEAIKAPKTSTGKLCVHFPRQFLQTTTQSCNGLTMLTSGG